MERRIIVFLVLSLTIIIAYPVFLEKFAPQGTGSPKVTLSPKGTLPQMAETSALGKNAVSSELTTITPAAGMTVSPSGPATPVVTKVIEGDLYRVVLSSHGGTITEWTLKKYTKKDDKGIEEPIQLIQKMGKMAPLSVMVSGNAAFTNLTYSLDETPPTKYKNLTPRQRGSRSSLSK